MSRVARDFYLAENAGPILETVSGHAHAAVNAMAAGPVRDKAKTRIGDAKELAQRFAHQTITVQTFAMDLNPDAPEAELRAWARDFKAAITG